MINSFIIKASTNIIYGDMPQNVDERFNMMTTEDLEEGLRSGAIQRYINELPDRLVAIGVKVLLTFIIAFIGIKLIKWLRTIVKKALTKAGIEKGVIQFTDSLVRTVLGIFLLLWVAVNFGVEATSIAALISSVSIAIGLALQGSLSNFAGGVLILVLKPFVVGDFIREDSHGNEGTVKEISLFYTKLLSYDNKTIILPNGSLANCSMVNFSRDGKRRIDLRVSISYESDIKKAKDVIYKILDANKLVIQDMEKIVFVADLADSGVIIGVRCYTNAADYFKLHWDLLEEIKYAFDEKSIGIPYPQMDVHFDSDNQMFM